jgi:hypothetical protein
MGGSSPPPAATSATTQQEPWAGAKPFLEGGRGAAHIDGGQQHTGIFPLAEQYFNQFSGLTPQQSGLNSAYAGELGARSNQLDQFNMDSRFMGGEYDPRLGMTAPKTQAAATMQSYTAGPASMDAYTTNQQQNMANLGGSNPTNAINQMLTGRPDSPYLSAMHQANINESMRGYDDAIRSLTTSVLPQISSEAFASGGYGGSRQGVAEGMALEQMQRNARDLGIAAMDSGNQLYGTAYESAQGRKADMANMMNNTALNVGQFNAGQQQAASQQNANLLQNANQFNAGQRQAASQQNADFWNQAQQFNASQRQNTDQFNSNLDLQQQAARAQNALQGVNLMKDEYAMQDNIFNQLQSIYGAPQSQYQNALNQYANIVSPGAAMGGSSSTNQQIPIYGSNAGQIFGGAASLAGLLGSLK